jgi:hypothetical protein
MKSSLFPIGLYANRDMMDVYLKQPYLKNLLFLPKSGLLYILIVGVDGYCCT